ncbi:LysR family transcriptional regulator [Nocardioides sp. Iso805N]|uniref:LysR family transcriptional regulator n=1 Tax=Nocardioides sp. Iso805N TaxID=1283287 RepID=UPI00037C9CFB|nr:LysR family transcriptional regulator [Nocardioides sp. Iso805N]
MALGGFDLNLLVPLQALLEEANVTRAGERLGVTQPTMSGSLARLRRTFGDELLVKSGREFELTPLAKDLLPHVQETVRLMGSALRLDDPFDPGTSERTFRLVMSDYAIAVMHGPLAVRLQAQAPGVRLEINRVGSVPDERLLVDHDVVIAPMARRFPGSTKPLWRDRMVIVADRANPRIRDGRLTVADLAALPHAVTYFAHQAVTPVDQAFNELGIERQITLRVYGFLPLLFAVQGTEMVAFVPERLTQAYRGGSNSLVAIQPPFDEIRLTEGYWYDESRLITDGGYAFLLGQLEAVVRDWHDGS